MNTRSDSRPEPTRTTPVRTAPDGGRGAPDTTGRPYPGAGTTPRTTTIRTPTEASTRDHTPRGHYRPTQPAATDAAPRAGSRPADTKAGTRTTTTVRPAPTSRPAKSDGRAPASTRYAPRDTTPTRTRPMTTRPSTFTPVLATPTRSKPRLAAGSATTPQLVPRASAPRLSQPRSPRYGSYTTYYPRSYIHGSAWCSTRSWNVWYGGSWCHRPWRSAIWWNYSTCSLPGFNPFWWNVGVLAPYYAWNYAYWNSCYSSSWYYGWSRPCGTSWNYWWYPSTTYCPTYLYVPSSVTVVANDELVLVTDATPEAPAAPAAAAAPGIVEVARAPAAAEVVDSSPEALAAKYVELGDFYFRADRFADAAEAYAKARSYAPDDASVHFVLADAVFANKDYHYAAFLIAEAVRLDPSIVTAATDKRTFYADPAAFEAQLDELQRYVAAKPYDAWAELVLGYNLRFSDRSTRAVASFRRVLELDPGNPTAAAFLADLTPKPLPTPTTDEADAAGKKDR